METRGPKKTEPELSEQQKKTGGSAATGTNDLCRCKEVSRLPPGGLLKLMMSDLAFWKKKKE